MNRSQILRQAKLTAALQVAPQLHTLVAQKVQADQNLAAGIAAQAAAARAVTQAANAARRPMARTFNNEVNTNAQVNQRIASDLASTGPSADPFRGALDSEAGLATTLATRQRSQSLKGLSDLATNAAKGRAFAVLNLLTQHNQDVGKLNSQITQLRGEQGAAATKGYLDLLGKQESLAVSRGNLNERKRHDLAIENGKGGSGASYKAKHGGFTQDQVMRATSDAKDAIREAQTWLKRGTPASALMTGGSGTTQQPVDATTGQPLTPKQAAALVKSGGKVRLLSHTVHAPKIPAIFIRAAQELQQGSLSQDTIHELRTRAVHIPAAWLPPQYRPGTGPAQGARPYGQRPT